MEIAQKKLFNCTGTNTMGNRTRNSGNTKISESNRLKENFEALKISLTFEGKIQIAKLNSNLRLFIGVYWAIKGSPFTLTN